MYTIPATAKLCFIKDQQAWFTTAPLNKQWGDDWNDAPYEHNAGRPYDPPEPYEVGSLFWEGSFDTPCVGHINSIWSVQDINAGKVPWLVSWGFEEKVSIMAGTTVEEFAKIIRQYGGDIYEPSFRFLEPKSPLLKSPRWEVVSDLQTLKTGERIRINGEDAVLARKIFDGYSAFVFPPSKNAGSIWILENDVVERKRPVTAEEIVERMFCSHASDPNVGPLGNTSSMLESAERFLSALRSLEEDV